MRHWTLAGSVALLLAVAGCGDEAQVQLAGDSADGPVVLCHGSPVPLAALDEARPASELGPEGLAALDGPEVPPRSELGDLADWTIVEESDDRLMLMRLLPEPEDRGDGMVFTHQNLEVERFGPPGDDGRPGWHLRAHGRCDLQRDLGRLGAADVALDPDAPPAADSASVDLLVTERACASGQRADDRVRLLSLEEDAAEVRVVVGVERLSGDQECPGNPPTPFTVELEAPLGDRSLMDASVHPPRPLDPLP